MSAAEQRQAVADLTVLASRELWSVWSQVRDLPPEQVRDALMDVLPLLGDEYGFAAATVAADYYETARERAGARGRFRPIVPAGPDRARWEALARWGVDPLFHEYPNPAAALERVEGGLGRTVADQHRGTIVESSVNDPAAQGWMRVGSGDTCDFCRMLIDRGGVYTQRGAIFKSHDHCNCVAAPSWEPARTVHPIAFTASRRTSSAADRASVRDHLREHYAKH